MNVLYSSSRASKVMLALSLRLKEDTKVKVNMFRELLLCSKSLKKTVIG